MFSTISPLAKTQDLLDPLEFLWGRKYREVLRKTGKKIPTKDDVAALREGPKKASGSNHTTNGTAYLCARRREPQKPERGFSAGGTLLLEGPISWIG